MGDSGRSCSATLTGKWCGSIGSRSPAASASPPIRTNTDELATVIRGTWYVGVGERFDPTKLKAYPAGSFVMIPAGVPHFVATKEGPVIVQLNGIAKWGTDYLEN